MDIEEKVENKYDCSQGASLDGNSGAFCELKANFF